MVLLAELGQCRRSKRAGIAALCLPLVLYWRPVYWHQHFRLEVLYFSPLWTWYCDRCWGKAPAGPGFASEIRARNTVTWIVKRISKLRNYKFGPRLPKESGEAAKLIHPSCLDYRIKKTDNHHSLAADGDVFTRVSILKVFSNWAWIFFRINTGFLLLWYFYWPLRKRQISVLTANLHHINSNSLLTVLDHLWTRCTIWCSPPTLRCWLLALRILHWPLNYHRIVLDSDFYFW